MIGRTNPSHPLILVHPPRRRGSRGLNAAPREGWPVGDEVAALPERGLAPSHYAVDQGLTDSIAPVLKTAQARGEPRQYF